MSISIKGHNYSGFIDYDREALKKASLETRILWLEYRVTKVLIGPLDQFFPPEGPVHTIVNEGDRTFNLSGVTLVACAIEALGHFLTGNPEDNGVSFKRWIKIFMPEWHKTAANGVKIQDWLWESARNGMAHQLAFKTGGTEVNKGQRFVVSNDDQIQMDPFIFYADFKVGVGQYFGKLKNTVELQTPFESRFMNTLLPQ